MSSSAALATVTATLQHLLSVAAPGVAVTTQPPSTARTDNNGRQLNIFLYSMHYNAAFSNAPMPHASRSGEQAFPPLPLVLKYLITAYGANDDDISGQQVMGQAMSLLHDHPLLSRADIEGVNPDSSLQQQIERVRITPDRLTLDDMSKLWASFQSAEYRLSIGYEVSVVLIESNRSARAPLPVLKRGGNDQGADVSSTPAPTLTGLRFPNQKAGAELGDAITLLGQHLTNENTQVRFQHPRLDTPIDIQSGVNQAENEMQVQLPALAEDPEVGANWPAGFYTLQLRVTQPNKPAWSSNNLSMPLSPSIELLNPSPATAPAGDVVLQIACLPRIVEGQTVRLLFGERMIAPDSVTTPADPAARTLLTFTVEDAVARVAPYVLRLRVDGVDSIPVDFSGDTPQFANNQMVTIT